MKKSVQYTIRIKEEDIKKIEAARSLGATMAAILLKGAEVIVDKAKS